MISAKIIEDSISDSGKRITTFELEMPRIILPEYNTHRMLSRNTASSRAIPISSTIKQITDTPFLPVYWGKHQSGMGASEEIDPASIELAKEIWLEGRDNAIETAKKLVALGVAKEIANRPLETWVYSKVVTTATEWDNLFHLRDHKDTQPEFRDIAKKMIEVYYASTPKHVEIGEWHLPYVSDADRERYDIEDCLKLSASLCGQVSYRKSDDTIEKARSIYQKLIGGERIHASPTEHQARPSLFADTISGNLRGWRQYRQSIPFNTCFKYSKES